MLLAVLQEGPRVFGVHLVGVGPMTGRKLLLTAAFVAALYIASYLLRWILRLVLGDTSSGRAAFWSRQGVKLSTVIVLVVGVISIWFDDPGRLGTAAGLVTAGVAVALQRVITSFAAYLIILRGRVYTVGDRITMGGVRGDVVALGFMQTTVMEMGEPPAVQGAPPSVWVNARQYTGRLVRVSNDKIFDAPVYNYTRVFPFFWEELHLPIKYGDDRARAEAILLDAARRHTADVVRDAEQALLTDHAYVEAQRLLAAHRAVLDRIAAALLEHETLSREELAGLFAGVEPDSRSADAVGVVRALDAGPTG